MKQGTRVLGLAALAAIGLLSATQADAYGRWRGGIWFGGPFWYPPIYSYPYVVERPVIVQAPAEPLVIQPSAAQQQQLWYYCRDAQMYYPYVTQCASPWQEVPASPAATVAPDNAPAATSGPVPSTRTPSSTTSTTTRTAPAPVPAAPRN